jgi:uncharacterized protein YcbK (DUF882 family)
MLNSKLFSRRWHMFAKYFDVNEFACRCGECRYAKGRIRECDVNPLLVEELDVLREALDAPLVVSSGLRCQEHNAACGGVSSSQHLIGTAADVTTADLDFLKDLTTDWPGGRGDGDTFVHLDVRPRRARWSY